MRCQHLLIVVASLLAPAIVGDARSGLARTAEAAAEPASSPRLQIVGTGGAAAIEVDRLTSGQLAALERLDAAALRGCLSVHVADLADPPALAGKVSLKGQSLRFQPRYELESGVRYRARFQLRGGQPVEQVLVRAKAARAAARVTHIYPSARRLPENQLKFYLHFSAPMSRGEAYQHVHLIDSAGKVVDGAFLELGEELWDRSMTRFTLLCDPGRVKRGLKPREELGPVLEEGKTYTLVIDGGWHDAGGATLEAGGRKQFDVLAPDDTPVDPRQWKLSAPRAGTRDPLVVRLGEPLDHSLLQRVLSIHARGGQAVAGAVEVADEETTWRFVPDKPWQAGDYRLVTATTLEDLAGNSIGRAFEVDEERPIERRLPSETVSLEFRVAPAAGN